MLSKEEILKASDLSYEEVSVPEWGGAVKIKSMTGAERDQFEEWIFKNKSGSKEMNWKNLRAKLLVMTLVDDTGKRLFDNNDIDVLGGKSAKALDRCFAVAQKLNAIGEKEVEELTKN